MRKYVLALIAGALAGCNSNSGGAGDHDAGATNAAANATASRPKRAAYCFFKDNETKGWTATAGPDGNVVVKGRAFRSDPRYMAQLGEAQVTGSHAEIVPTIGLNTTGFAAPENWWDVSATIPNSSAVTSVSVRCGKKMLAELSIKREG
jgi:hypothetical protein